MHCLSLTHVISSKQRQGLLMYIQLEKRDIFKLLFLRWFLSIDCLILCVCVWAHECLSVHVEVRGEFIGLSFLLLSCGLWGIRSDSKTWQQAPLCTEPASSWLKDYFHMPTCQLFTHKHIKSTVSLSFAKMKHIIINKEVKLWGAVYLPSVSGLSRCPSVSGLSRCQLSRYYITSLGNSFQRLTLKFWRKESEVKVFWNYPSLQPKNDVLMDAQ